MKALVSTSYGPLEDLVLADLPKPAAGPGQVLVRTEAAALNPADVALVTGLVKDTLPVAHPFVPGIDISGVVEAVGDDVTRFAAGDPIVASMGLLSGAFAEYALVNDAPLAAIRPGGLDAAHGAALPTGSLTAAALLDLVAAAAGATVLVVGATGGVGSYMVQLARRAGFQVLATGRSEDEAFLRDLGADDVIDYQKGDIAEETLRRIPGGVDVVIDLAHAGPALAETAAAAKSGGQLISPLGGPPAFERNISAAYGGTTGPEGRLAAFAAQAADGRLRVEIGLSFPFADAREALTTFAAQHIRGKVTVTF